MDHANRISHRTRSLFSPHSDNRQMPRESRLWRLVETQAQLIARRQGTQLRLADWPSIFQPAFRLLRDWAVPNSAKQIILRGQRRMIRVTVPLFPTFRKLRGTIRQPQESSAQEAAGAASIFRSLPGKRLQVFQAPAPVPGSTSSPAFNLPATPPLPISDVEQGTVHSGYAVITPDPNSAAPQTTVTFGSVSGGAVQ